MAKKEEKKDKGGTKSSVTGTGGKATSGNGQKKPLKSGKIKGPMGVGKGKEPGGKEANEKNNLPNEIKKYGKDQQLIEPAVEPKKLPQSNMGVPEELPKGKPPRKKRAGTKINQEGERDRDEQNKVILEKKDKDKKSKEGKTKPVPKKMSRRKADKSISAEEKMKLPNTAPVDDLTKIAEDSAKKVADTFLPDQEAQQQLKDLAKNILPSKKKIKKSLDEITENISPISEKVKNMGEKILPEEELELKAEKSTPEEPSEGTTTSRKTDNEMPTLFSEYDVFLFKEGKHYHLYKKFGAHLMEVRGTKGVYFSLWAPNAKRISVIGDFNNWERERDFMEPRQDESGIWEVFISEAKHGSLYKYFIQSQNGYEVEKGDPFAFFWEVPPKTASVVWDLQAGWNDHSWLEQRKQKAGSPQPFSVYEMHMGSWRRVPEENSRSLTYRELAEELPSYLKEMGFTHVEFMPVMEHPFYGSWGYQITGYFAPSSRYGTPQDFMHLIDVLHQSGIGVILDWVPSHFPSDMHGLHYFDGTFLYEHQDKKKGFHPDWQSYIFNYGRSEVRSFLISNSLFWLDKFHIDGLRVDAVASMLYLDYSRNEGEWIPNKYGGRENLEAISFLKEFNEVVYGEYPDILSIAEESTAWPMVSKPTYLGGLGFGMKWMMGWMHDTLEYFKKDPVHRKHHQNTITFSLNYAFSENFMLPLSHDEVVYGKQSLWNKMPGDQWNKFANLRSLYSYMFAHPGTKLLFMGGEFAQISEWDHDSSLEWHLTHELFHGQIQETIKTLNNIYKNEPSFYEYGFDQKGFEWVDMNDSESSILIFARKGKRDQDTILVACNFTPVTRENYRIGVPFKGNWREIFNSDEAKFGGSDVKNSGILQSSDMSFHNKEQSITLTLPPMAVVYLKKE